jgi:hypothetical protein
VGTGEGVHIHPPATPDSIKLIDGIEGEVGIELKVDGKLSSVDDAETWLRTHTKADGIMGIEDNVNVDDEADLDHLV